MYHAAAAAAVICGLCLPTRLTNKTQTHKRSALMLARRANHDTGTARSSAAYVASLTVPRNQMQRSKGEPINAKTTIKKSAHSFVYVLPASTGWRVQRSRCPAQGVATGAALSRCVRAQSGHTTNGAATAAAAEAACQHALQAGHWRSRQQCPGHDLLRL